jgi:Icc protein
LGNHDDRDDFFRSFEGPAGGGRTVDDRHVITEVAGPIRLIVLDSLLYVDMIPGLLGLPQRTWLETYLKVCDDRPTIVFLHHTPKGDLLDTRRLFDIIGPATKVKAVVYGHSHKFRISQYKGIHLINLPATGFNFGDNQPVGWVETSLTDRGGQFTLHALAGDRRDNGLTGTLPWRS